MRAANGPLLLRFRLGVRARGRRVLQRRLQIRPIWVGFKQRAEIAEGREGALLRFRTERIQKLPRQIGVAGVKQIQMIEPDTSAAAPAVSELGMKVHEGWKERQYQTHRRSPQLPRPLLLARCIAQPKPEPVIPLVDAPDDPGPDAVDDIEPAGAAARRLAKDVRK